MANFALHDFLRLHEFVHELSMNHQTSLEFRLIGAVLALVYLGELRLLDSLILFTNFVTQVSGGRFSMREDLSTVIAKDHVESWMNFLVVLHESSDVPEDFVA
jgi:hypothetical protein